jgi:hypothetical protein
MESCLLADMLFNTGALLADQFSGADALRAVNVTRSRPSTRTAYLTLTTHRLLK